MRYTSLLDLRGRLLRPVAALCAVVWLLESCYSWGPAQQGAARQAIVAANSQRRIQVVRVGGARQEIAGAYIRGDTLIGFDPFRTSNFGMRRFEIRVPFDSVAAVKTRHYSAGKTAVLVVPLFLAALGVVVVRVCSNGGCNIQFGPGRIGG